MNITAPASALQVSISRHDITAHDVANINTRGFREYSPNQTDLSPEGVRLASISRNSASGVDLARETAEQITNKQTLIANTKALKVKDRMIGELIDILA